MRQGEPVIELLEKLEREIRGEEKLLPLPWPNVSFGLGGGIGHGTLTFLAGQAGSGKSLAVTELCIHAHRAGWRWCYMPFEKNRLYALRRFLAVYLRSWDALKPEHAAETTRRIKEDEAAFEFLVKVGDCIFENPAQAVTDETGRRTFPPIRFADVVQSVREKCEQNDLLVIDPLAAIEFDDGDRDQWSNQTRFVRELSGLASETGCRILVVHHVRKLYGPQQFVGLDEIAGASGIGRFCDNALVLEFHKVPAENDVIGHDGITSLVTHEKTMTLAKCRDGGGTNWRIAMDLSKNELRWTEHGIVKAKLKERRG